MDVNEIHFEGKIAQKAIVEKNGKVLLVRDPREEKEIWELPGGRMNIDEEPRAALQREFLEEMGVGLNVHEVIHMEQFVQGSEKKHAFVIVYRATLPEENADFQLANDEVSEIRWCTQDEIVSLALFPEYEHALVSYFSKVL